MMILIVAISVAIVCFILYALERRSRREPISWEQAGKLSLVGGIIAAGITFAVGSDNVTIMAKPVIDSLPSAVQDMFVGQPTF
jgi:uncharacterized membrane protein